MAYANISRFLPFKKAENSHSQDKVLIYRGQVYLDLTGNLKDLSE